MTDSPSGRPSTTPSSPFPSGAASKWSVTSAPLRCTRTRSAEMPRGTVMWIRASSPLTYSAGLDSTSIPKPPPRADGGPASVASGAAAIVAIANANDKPVARMNSCLPGHLDPPILVTPPRNHGTSALSDRHESCERRHDGRFVATPPPDEDRPASSNPTGRSRPAIARTERPRCAVRGTRSVRLNRHDGVEGRARESHPWQCR